MSEDKDKSRNPDLTFEAWEQVENGVRRVVATIGGAAALSLFLPEDVDWRGELHAQIDRLCAWSGREMKKAELVKAETPPDESRPLAPLRTWEGATPGPWVESAADDFEWVGTRQHDPTSSVPRSREDVAHIATWDPETCRKVVELLDLAYSTIKLLPTKDTRTFATKLNALLSSLENTDGT